MPTLNERMNAEKPLFIPLYMHWFELFRRGEKSTEFRNYGPRWNERTCRIGRKVTLSGGYGKCHRLSGTITAFRRKDYAGKPPIAEIDINVH